MSKFIQLHFLTSYPPANLNRDDTGRPKTAVMGGVQRQRISSQSLKRAWRTSDVFGEKLEGHLAKRTQRLGEEIQSYLIDKGMKENQAIKTASSIAGIFGKLKKSTGDQGTESESASNSKEDDSKSSVRIEQLAFISPEEREKAIALADEAIAGKKIEPKASEVLCRVDTAADIAMFGRMLADHPEFNREAAVQVAHAITTHKVMIEDDYYTAVDDLKDTSEDAGAGFIGVQEFSAGVFYLYICINYTQLVDNLGGDETLAGTTLAALIEAAATIAPKGKQASFASRARADYILAEKGEQQPRSLAAAFLDPVKRGHFMNESIQKMEIYRESLDKAYGACVDHCETMNVSEGKGSLQEIIAFASNQ